MKFTLSLLVVALCASSVYARGRFQTVVADNNLEEEHVLTPAGPRHKSCVHQVAHGAKVHSEGNEIVIEEYGNVRRVQRCNKTPPTLHNRKRYSRRSPLAGAPEVDGNGWQQYVHQNVSNDITTFNGKWNVPGAPRESAATLFTFTGLQNIDWVPPQPQPSQAFDIIQPVLQYGYSAGGGGAYWTIGSWYVTLTTDVVVSPLHKVEAGDEITGIMEKNGPDSWYISTVGKDGHDVSINVTRSVLSAQPWTYVTLEVYDVETCDQYPPSDNNVVHYTDLVLDVGGQAQTPAWSVGQQGQQPPICNSQIKIVSPTAIDITF